MSLLHFHQQRNRCSFTTPVHFLFVSLLLNAPWLVSSQSCPFQRQHEFDVSHTITILGRENICHCSPQERAEIDSFLNPLVDCFLVFNNAYTGASSGFCSGTRPQDSCAGLGATTATTTTSTGNTISFSGNTRNNGDSATTYTRVPPRTNVPADMRGAGAMRPGGRELRGLLRHNETAEQRMPRKYSDFPFYDERKVPDFEPIEGDNYTDAQGRRRLRVVYRGSGFCRTCYAARQGGRSGNLRKTPSNGFRFTEWHDGGRRRRRRIQATSSEENSLNGAEWETEKGKAVAAEEDGNQEEEEEEEDTEEDEDEDDYEEFENDYDDDDDDDDDDEEGINGEGESEFDIQKKFMLDQALSNNPFDHPTRTYDRRNLQQAIIAGVDVPIVDSLFGGPATAYADNLDFFQDEVRNEVECYLGFQITQLARSRYNDDVSSCLFKTNPTVEITIARRQQC